MFVQDYRENPTQQPKMLTHLVRVLGFLTLCCSGVSLLTDCSSAPDWLLQSLTPNWPPQNLTPDWLLRGLVSNWVTSFIFSSSLAVFCGHSSLCGLRTKIDKEISRVFGTTSKMLKMIPPATHNTQTHTHIHLYTSRYIYIHMWILMIMTQMFQYCGDYIPESNSG